jgi:hypothetical protein
MPDEESVCSSSSRQPPPKLHLDLAHCEYDNASPTSDILLDAVAPRKNIHKPENIVKTEDGMRILCDSPRPEYTASEDHAETLTEDGHFNLSEHDSVESHAQASSRTLTTDHDTSSNNTEPPELPSMAVSNQHEHTKLASSGPTTPQGAPPPYADPARRRTPQERNEEPTRVKPRKAIGNFTLTNTLGAGSMGKVKLAVHNLTDEKVNNVYYISWQLRLFLERKLSKATTSIWIKRIAVERFELSEKQALCFYCTIHILSA